MSLRMIIFLLLSTALIIRCSEEDRLASASTPLQLEDSEWQVASIKNLQTDSTTYPAQSISLKFENEQFSLILDINRCGGSYKTEDNQRIIFSDLNCTEACCDSPFALDVAESLKDIDKYETGQNKLILKSASREIVLVPA